jgi:Ca2+-binding EF-hand superfamily protein
MSGVSGVGSGYNPYATLEQQLFNQIDSSGSGSITESELETAVTNAGGTQQAADALYAELDPNNTGSVTEQQFSQNLPTSPLSSAVTSQLFGYQAGNAGPAQFFSNGGNFSLLSMASLFGGNATGATGANQPGQFAQNLFSQIDTSGTGSITQSELEAAVTAAGGTTQAADALYAKLDPNNTGSVSEQQFAQTLQQMHGHHHHHGGGGDAAQDALSALINGTNGTDGSASSPSQLAQTLFSQIAPSGSSSFTQSELETAVTAAGGTTQQADALYAQLDPNNTGSVTEQQLAQYLQPPSASGNTAQDALLALIQGPNNSSSAANSSTSTSSTNAFAPISISGNTAQDALAALVQGLQSNQSSSVTGNSPQDAVEALLQSLDANNGSASQNPLAASGSNGGNPFGGSNSNNPLQDLFSLLQEFSFSQNGSSSQSTSGSNASSGTNISEVNLAISVYQAQIAQQSFVNNLPV